MSEANPAIFQYYMYSSL